MELAQMLDSCREGVRPGVDRSEQDLVLEDHVPHEAGGIRLDERL
jgi:hypothetical protein